MNLDAVRSRPVLLAVPAVLALGVAVVVLLVVQTAGSDTPADEAGTDFDRSAWPGPGSAGVPAGTRLTPYAGPCTITSSVTITAVDATGTCGEILVRAPDVVITKSRLPRVDATEGGNESVTLTDDTVLGGQWSDGAIWGYNITATRVDVTGGQHNVHCADNCTVVDSWLHDQWNPDGQAFHNNAFISNGGSTMVIRHNTLHCTAILNSTDGGCTADLSLFGDFGPVTDVTVEDNLFLSSQGGYCGSFGYNPGKEFGKAATAIVVVGNVFERGPSGTCGVYGAVTSFWPGGEGNRWADNTWDDGTVLTP